MGFGFFPHYYLATSFLLPPHHLLPLSSWRTFVLWPAVGLLVPHRTAERALFIRALCHERFLLNAIFSHGLRQPGLLSSTVPGLVANQCSHDGSFIITWAPTLCIWRPKTIFMFRFKFYVASVCRPIMVIGVHTNDHNQSVESHIDVVQVIASFVLEKWL